MGYGFEYTTVILQKIMVDNPNAHIGVVALHNNILTIYIELGFLGILGMDDIYLGISG